MKKLLYTVALATLISTGAQAKLFSLNLTQGALSDSRSYDSVLDLFDDYEKGRLNKIISSYDDTAASSGIVEFRGIPMTFDFDSSAKLTFKVNSLGINETFDGGTQKASFKLFTEYLKKNRNNLLKKIARASVETTPFDAVAGNPNSLMSRMADESFARAGGNSMGGFTGYLAPGASHHTITHNGEDIHASTFSLPIGATYNFGESDWALLWDMPITYTSMEGSESYMAQMGLGLKIPVMKYWNITPAIRGGVVGSSDMLSGGVLYSGTLTSHVAVPVGNWTLGMTNMAGILRDYSVKIKDYEIAYDIQNQVFKNGVHARYDFNDKYAASGAYNYTFYTGDKLYIEHYHDVELAFTRKTEGLISGVSLVGSYTFDKDYKAYHLGLRFSF